jgi:hypothetical protein
VLDKLRSYRPSHAVVVAYLALFVALGGSSYAAITVTGKNVKNSSLTGKDIKNNSLTGKDVKGVKSADVADRSLLSKDFKPGQLPAGSRGPKGDKGDKGDQGQAGVVGNLFVERLDLALNDGTGNSGSVVCPAGQKIIGGSANLESSGSADVNLTVSRPAQGTNQTLPTSGQAFDRWRGAAFNPAGGTGATTLRVWAICTPGTQQPVPTGVFAGD